MTLHLNSVKTSGCRGQGAGGFTILEVMVALFVLSVGLLGLAGMMTQSLKFNQGAEIQTRATQLAYTLAETMRANADNALLYTPLDDPNVPCNPLLATVTNDMACWYDAMLAALPGGTATLVESPAGTGQFDLTLSWADRTNPTGGAVITQTWTFTVN